MKKVPHLSPQNPISTINSHVGSLIIFPFIYMNASLFLSHLLSLLSNFRVSTNY